MRFLLLNKKRVGFLTIGQSPRDDIMDEMKPLLAPHIDVVEYGLLDDLSPEEIGSLSPRKQELPLVSRLRDGSQVLLSERKTADLLPDAVEYMKKEMNVDTVGMLCTHTFPQREYACPVVFPFGLMKSRLDEISRVQKLGVVVPLENQIDMTLQKWSHKRAFVVAKSPYAKGTTWKDTANALMAEKAEAVVLDCIGYTLKDKHEIEDFLDIPILLPRTILASAINDLV